MTVVEGAVLWTPSAARVQQARLTSYMVSTAPRYGFAGGDYFALHAWSTAELGRFWQSVADFCNLPLKSELAYVPPAEPGLRGASWFPDCRFNFASCLLAPWQRHPSRNAIVAYAEGRERQCWSGARLTKTVAALVASLQQHGVGEGDRVAGVLANTPEAIAAMLATSYLGAVWCSASPDFGAAAIEDRLLQVAPKVLFYTPAYMYAGKRHETKDKISATVRALRPVGLKAAIAIEHLPAAEGSSLDVGETPGAPLVQSSFATIHEQAARLHDGAAASFLAGAKLWPFAHPLYILFSSGTTGVPKGIIHGAGGTLLQHAKEHALHADMGESSCLLYFTTLGWMMWNWMVSALAQGTSLVLFDGSPSHPDASVLWRLADAEGVTHLGISPKLLSVTASFGISPRAWLGSKSLRCLLSTGSPLLPEQYAYVYRELASDIHLASISGGTDIVSCFMLGVPTLPVRAGEIQAAGLGMDVAAFDAEGQPVTGQKGELVCRRPFPSMPLGFWRDSDGRRYSKAYFEYFPKAHNTGEVWRHGDFIEFKPSHGIVVYGRSDATLNPGGVRIGTAELYRQVETMPEVQDSLAIGRELDGDTEIWLFVKMQPGCVCDAPFMQRLRETIRRNLSPRHVPRCIFAVADIPYTRSGKKLELAVTEAVHGRPVTNLSAIANPEALEAMRLAAQQQPG